MTRLAQLASASFKKRKKFQVSKCRVKSPIPDNLNLTSSPPIAASAEMVEMKRRARLGQQENCALRRLTLMRAHLSPETDHVPKPSLAWT